MEKQKLPNSTLILIFGILSIIGCCCYGIVGIILGIVVLVLAKSATATYMENPELYSGYDNVKIGKILGIIGIVIGVISLIINIYFIATYGFMDQEQIQELIEEISRQQQ